MHQDAGAEFTSDSLRKGASHYKHMEHPVEESVEKTCTLRCATFLLGGCVAMDAASADGVAYADGEEESAEAERISSSRTPLTAHGSVPSQRTI